MYAIGQQQKIAENLFQHPFAVSNAGLDFRSDVLDFRKYMLETMLSRKQVGNTQLARIRGFEDRMDRHLAIIRKEFLGDQARVDDIFREMDAWKKIRETIKAQLIAGNTEEAQSLAMLQASPHIEQILVDTDYVITFARSRARLFLEEGRTQLVQTKLLLILLAVLTLITYMMLSTKLRQEIHEVYDQEEHDAAFDGLCGMHNRRSFMKLGEAEIKRVRRHDLCLSLLMLDLDHFKNVNDTYGHAVGDSVLCQFGVISSLCLRGADVLGRIGGEEFAILLPHTDLSGAMNVAERIRQEVSDCNFKVVEEKHLQVTVSIGVSTLDGDMDTLDALLKRADEALYRSKNEGRNRVTAG